jgi:hypothetical protein
VNKRRLVLELVELGYEALALAAVVIGTGIVFGIGWALIVAGVGSIVVSRLP